MTSVSVSSMELPWSKCLLGCEIPAEGRVHLLPCLHVLCSDACLEKGIAGDPHQCRKFHRKFTIDQVKRNIKLDDFLKKKTKPEDVLKCGTCSWNNPALSYCAQCKAYLCNTCTEYHNRGNSSHQLETNMNQRKSMEIQKQNQCRSHVDKVIAFFCLTCQVKMCEDCKPRHPSGTHQVVAVEEEMANSRRRIHSTKKVGENANNMAISKLEKKLESLNNAEWKEFVSGVDNLVTETKEKLLDEGRKQRELKMKRIETKLKDLQDTSFLLQVNDISEKLDLDDTWMINVARSSLPQSKSNFSNISFTKQTLEENFDDFVEENQSLVEVLPELKKSLFPRMSGSRSNEVAAGTSSSPIPGPSSLMANHARSSSSDIPNEDVPLVRSISCESTGGKLSDRPLGMPHIAPLTSLSSHDDANPPPRAPEDLEDGDDDGAETTSSQEMGSPSLSLSPISAMSACSVPSLRSPSMASKKGERGRKRKSCDDSSDVIVVENSPKRTERRVPRKKALANSNRSADSFPEAPANSYDKMGGRHQWRQNYFPLQTHDRDDCSGHCCAICIDGGSFMRCSFCKRVFHLRCHIPAYYQYPDVDWRCNHDRSKEMVEQEIQGNPDKPGSEKEPLTKANAKQFAQACNFMIAAYRIPERPTMQWYFPEEYQKIFGKVPYHLDFLRKKLCHPPRKGQQQFSGVMEFMQAFKQMLIQAFMIYDVGNKYRKDALNYLEKFKPLIEEFYPEHKDLFQNIIHE